MVTGLTAIGELLAKGRIRVPICRRVFNCRDGNDAAGAGAVFDNEGLIKGFRQLPKNHQDVFRSHSSMKGTTIVTVLLEKSSLVCASGHQGRHAS